MSNLSNTLDELYAKLTVTASYDLRIPRDYVASWLSQQYNENNEPIEVTDWLVDIVYLLADVTRHRVYLSGAAQVAKTLASILTAKLLTECYDKLRIVWVYASREQGDTYPSIQIQPIFGGVRSARTIEGSRHSRIYIRHANTSVDTPSMAGKSLVKSGLSSLTADIAVCDEVSQWRTSVDPQDRVKRSVFKSQPLRFYGTPGSGNGIEANMTEYNAHHVACTATCVCGLTRPADLHDLIDYDTEKSGRPYNYRFKSCECGESTRMLAGSWRYVTEQDTPAIAMWLHPFLHCATPDDMDKQLTTVSTRSLVDKSVANIYQQLLGTINRYGNQAILASDVTYATRPGKPTAAYYGIDQGRRELYLVELLDYSTPEQQRYYVNYCNTATLTTAANYLESRQALADYPTFAVTDFAPDAEAALYLRDSISMPLAMAIQANSPTANYDYKLDTAYSNGLPYQVIRFQYRLWVQAVIDAVREGQVDFNREQSSELLTRHLTSVRYLAETMQVQRPADKTDDLFFALMFAMFARTLGQVRYTGIDTTQTWR